MNPYKCIVKHLEVFQQTFTNSLTQDSPLAPQPIHIKPPLRIHQLAALEAMRQKELSLQIGFKYLPSSEEVLFSRFAILGDSVGVGKTLMCLGHISQMSTHPLTQNQVPLSNLNPESTFSCFSISPTLATPQENLYDSLIVVPHTIYRQWQECITTQTTLKTHLLKTFRDLDKDSLITNLRSSHVTLISNTLFPNFMNTLRLKEVQPTWRRIFYDEADSIKIPSTCKFPKAFMTWYISATYKNLLFPNFPYHSHMLRLIPEEFIQSLAPELQESVNNFMIQHPSVTFYKTLSIGFFKDHLLCTHSLRGHLVIRSSQEFLNYSIQLPELHQQIIRCQLPRSYRILDSSIPPETETLLHAGDIQGAFQSLGISTHTHLTIVEAVTEYRKKELQRLQRVLEFKRQEEYSSPQAKEQAIQNLEKKIQNSTQQIQGIQARILEASKDSCGICFDEPTNTVITPCCTKLFCGNCMLTWFRLRSVCPMCRSEIEPGNLTSLGTSANIIPIPVIPQKMDALLQILQENPTGRFLIFSRFDSPLQTIQEQVRAEYPSDTLQGNKDTIAKTLSEFEKGNIRILLLNSQIAAAGLNIPTATHLILMHKMGTEEEKQILGRAYRLGRTKPLHFIKLLHTRE